MLIVAMDVNVIVFVNKMFNEYVLLLVSLQLSLNLNSGNNVFIRVHCNVNEHVVVNGNAKHVFKYSLLKSFDLIPPRPTYTILSLLICFTLVNS